jgi:hypothetical protein
MPALEDAGIGAHFTGGLQMPIGNAVSVKQSLSYLKKLL